MKAIPCSADGAAGQTAEPLVLDHAPPPRSAAPVGVSGGGERLNAIVDRQGRARCGGGQLQRLSRRSKPRSRSGVPRAATRSVL